jgi:V/A-type H+-transporting ATPase subunit I
MYGAPSSREIDPSPVLMPFFVLFFGIMLGDGGYGLLLTAVSIFILNKKQLEDSTRKFMKLIMYCGIATIFWGAMLGSWFGIESLSGTALWLVPTRDTEALMSWSLVFGIIHMYSGLFLKAINLIRRKQVLDAVFDVLFMYILFTGFILSVLSFAPGVDPNSDVVLRLTKIGNILFIVGAALVVLTAGRKSKKIFGKIFGGLGKLYDVVGFMGDTLSYMRLLAIGLAGSIISTIVNSMAGSLGGNIIMTVLGGGLIIISGHAINIGMGLLGAFVHSCRLQYLEFFGKFLEGGGQYFRPFKADTKYIVVKPDLAKFAGNVRQAIKS